MFFIFFRISSDFCFNRYYSRLVDRENKIIIALLVLFKLIFAESRTYIHRHCVLTPQHAARLLTSHVLLLDACYFHMLAGLSAWRRCHFRLVGHLRSEIFVI